jgi:hypothetical protein
MQKLITLILCLSLIGCANFPIQHTLIALSATGTGEVLGNCWAGAAVGSAIMMSREEAQAEYRYIERYGNGQRSNLGFGMFDKRVWDSHSLNDWLYPTLGSFALCGAIYAYKRWM